jgi:hypothetical protein
LSDDIWESGDFAAMNYQSLRPAIDHCFPLPPLFHTIKKTTLSALLVSRGCISTSVIAVSNIRWAEVALFAIR